MLENGYSPRLAAGVVAGRGGTLASLIPPSAILVIYAIIVEESVGTLILAGFLPGIVSAMIYAALIIGQCTMRPEMGRPIAPPPMGDRLRTIPPTIPIFCGRRDHLQARCTLGWATPTEAGAPRRLRGDVHRDSTAECGGRPLRSALLETAKLTVMIFALIWGVLIFVRFLGFAGLPEAFATWLVNLPLPAVVTMIFILLGYAVLGMFMDAIGMLLLTLPGGVSRGRGSRLRPNLVRNHRGQDVRGGASSPRRSGSTATSWPRCDRTFHSARCSAGILPFFLADAGDRRAVPRLPRDRPLAAEAGE